ncbi:MULTISPECIES: SMI1/KNR4 family protein [Vibrio]|uniref:SMI1/KNR4 family protein SUKH-1 n=1 Tax=Vibrio diazotrophicus TaxID=685 RepID=A0A329DTT9_VIBDI|nr:MULTISPECIES: SMI1/KNR4 family protein [Vibrio]MCZ4295787.1 SMI1/KNR4 family protein [Vibrio sinaloensis]MCZ4374361.1 SMI1/KNR4 family protein [Vibrio diazotrophicus]PNH91931.1 SMI1/KNR4 family protein [Vibrio diazotrophicus]RAS53249.1 SMI1/KNR4 family protein SUKH-1 [Vibrio diazotrophicus]
MSIGNEWLIFEEDHLPLRDELIESVSTIIQFSLPQDYVECVKYYHGGQPKNGSLSIDVDGSSWGIGFGELLTLDPLESCTNVISSLSKLRKIHGISKNYLPIAIGAGGDYLCLDYSDSITNPTVVFWFHELEGEDAIFPVADTFTQVLDMLKPYDE